MFLKKLTRFKFKIGFRARLLALFILIFGGIFVAFSAVLYRQLVGNHEKEFDAALYNYGVDVARAIDVDLFGEVMVRQNILSESEKVFPFALGETYIQILSTANGRLVARSKSLGKAVLPYPNNEYDGSTRKVVVFRTLEDPDARRLGIRPATYRILDYFIDKSGPWDFVLQIAVPMRLLELEQRSLLGFFIIGIPVMLIIAALAGWFFTGQALAPLRSIVSTSKKLSAQQLSERIPMPKFEDEISEMVVSLNDLFQRLEIAFLSQETFISDASHQLKTPLAILRGELDLVMSKQRSPEEVKEFLGRLSQEVNYLSRIVEDLLVMARMDLGANALSWKTLRIDEVLLEVSARYETAAKAKQITFHTHFEESPQSSENMGAFELRAEPDLLRSLLENLIGNAIKYSPSASPVYLRLRDFTDSLEFSVQDLGPGIAPEDRPLIFTRFFRAEASRAKVSGSGLGLPIAKRIADLHGAKISFDSEIGKGTLFRVLFKKG